VSADYSKDVPMLESASPLSVVDWNKEREDPLRTHVIVFQFLAVLLCIYCCTICRRPATIYVSSC
jgi:hypothetical protein